jgi:hypothetical protein
VYGLASGVVLTSKELGRKEVEENTAELPRFVNKIKM